MLHRISVIFLSFLHFYHYFLFNQRLLEPCLEKTLCFRQNIIFLTQNDKKIKLSHSHYEITLFLSVMKLLESCHFLSVTKLPESCQS